MEGDSADQADPKAHETSGVGNLHSDVEQLVRLAEREQLAGLSVQCNGRKIAFVRGPALRSEVVAKGQALEEHAPEGEAKATHAIRSPFVGIFHRHGAVNKKVLAEPGDRISTGQPLGCVESMRVMNEVVSDASGELTEFVVREGEAVEYGQPVAILRLDA